MTEWTRLSKDNVCSALDIAKEETAAAIDLPGKPTFVYSVALRTVRFFYLLHRTSENQVEDFS